MKAIVNQETCISCGVCIDQCPEVFEWEDDKAKTIQDPVASDQQDCAKEAAEACPVDAIEIKE